MARRNRVHVTVQRGIGDLHISGQDAGRPSRGRRCRVSRVAEERNLQAPYAESSQNALQDGFRVYAAGRIVGGVHILVSLDQSGPQASAGPRIRALLPPGCVGTHFLIEAGFERFLRSPVGRARSRFDGYVFKETEVRKQFLNVLEEGTRRHCGNGICEGGREVLHAPRDRMFGRNRI